MDERALRKAYDAEWKTKEPQKYTFWLVCQIVSFLPLIVGFIVLLSNEIDDDTTATLLRCFFMWLNLEVVGRILRWKHDRGWKSYRDAHMK